jgi:hypothetical protein
MQGDDDEPHKGGKDENARLSIVRNRLRKKLEKKKQGGKK